ncbi:hypothetical protein P7K49_011470 [Saguinus oedipus]|uniref:SH3 domain-containing protein n=1 Tax=Saguinus oedipus TaxID=9490 RepID=A0ABQ9VQS1_SAGOE|nr:hypothetical protein P7K49_011470 [Saguinus oedipus]
MPGAKLPRQPTALPACQKPYSSLLIPTPRSPAGDHPEFPSQCTSRWCPTANSPPPPPPLPWPRPGETYKTTWIGGGWEVAFERGLLPVVTVTPGLRGLWVTRAGLLLGLEGWGQLGVLQRGKCVCQPGRAPLSLVSSSAEGVGGASTTKRQAAPPAPPLLNSLDPPPPPAVFEEFQRPPALELSPPPPGKELHPFYFQPPGRFSVCCHSSATLLGSTPASIRFTEHLLRELLLQQHCGRTGVKEEDCMNEELPLPLDLPPPPPLDEDELGLPPPPPGFGPDEPSWVPATYLEKVVTLYPYTGQKDNELSFSEGTIICVTRRYSDGWCEGISSEGTGLFPGNYVEPSC